MSGVTATSTCAPTSTTTDTNCDVVNMPVPTPAAAVSASSAGSSASTAQCANMTQFSALNRPELYFPPGTSATFSTISGRTQLMAATIANSRLYMQSNTLVRVQATAPTLVLTEGGSITLSDNSMVLINAPATLYPGSASMTLTNGGQHVDAGGNLISTLSAGSSYALGAAPYKVSVGRSITLPVGYLIPTVPTTSGQAPYVQLPLASP